jgi:hypothetical protein
MEHRRLDLAVVGALCALVVGLLVVPALAGAAACENEARRVEQNATYLPDCRAYEKVSPEEKGGGDIVGDGQTVIAAAGGGAVEFATRTPFGDEVGAASAGQTPYVARRDASGTGWASHAVAPTPRSDAYQTFFTATKIALFSDDLSTAVVWGYDLPGGGGEPLRNNIYSENVQTRALQALTVSQEEELQPFDFLNLEYAGISADAHHVAFTTYRKLLAQAEPGVSNVYQSDNGVLSLAGILPDGSVPAGGSYATVGNNFVGGEGYRGAMSADGSRLLFMGLSGEQPQLYMRIDGERTAWISEAENGETIEPSEVHVQYMTPDGKYVFFMTSSKLLTEDENEGPDLYRWTYGPDPEHEKNLTLITHEGNYQVVVPQSGVVGASDDGSRVYYQTQEGELAVWDGGVTRLISGKGGVPPDPALTFSLAATSGQPGLGRASANGMWLAFITHLFVDSDNHYEMYLYSLKDEQVTCVSCPSGPAAHDTTMPGMVEEIPGMEGERRVTNGEPHEQYPGIRPQFLSEDGRAFFSTAEALVPQDTNGVADVYEYDGETGALNLLSSGTGANPTTFADASASGEDVFVETRQPLLAEDRDSLVDMYDVREGGGFPAPPSPAPCSGDECQPQPAPTPSFGAPTTAGFAGAGNLVAGKPVARGGANAGKLAKTLRACRKKRNRARRKTCEMRARKRYGKKAKSARGTK